MAYSKQTWVDTPGHPNAQLNAARLNHIESGIEASGTYTNAVPGSRFTLLYNGSSGFVDPATGLVAASRPSVRTDIYFDLVGGTAAVADPAWMLVGDAREITA